MGHAHEHPTRSRAGRDARQSRESPRPASAVSSGLERCSRAAELRCRDRPESPITTGDFAYGGRNPEAGQTDLTFSVTRAVLVESPEIAGDFRPVVGVFDLWRGCLGGPVIAVGSPGLRSRARPLPPKGPAPAAAQTCRRAWALRRVERRRPPRVPRSNRGERERPGSFHPERVATGRCHPPRHPWAPAATTPRAALRPRTTTNAERRSQARFGRPVSLRVREADRVLMHVLRRQAELIYAHLL